MQPLRFRYWWLSGGILLVAMVLYVMVIPVGGGLVTRFGDKFGHFIAFFALMSWFCGVFLRGKWLWVAVALAALGIAIELIQGQLSYRSAELADGVYDCIGIGVAWIGAWLGLGQWALLIESWWPVRLG